MMKCVHLDETVIDEARAGGSYAWSALVTVLRSFDTNCVLVQEPQKPFPLEKMAESMPPDLDPQCRYSLLRYSALLQNRSVLITPSKAGKLDAVLSAADANIDFHARVRLSLRSYLHSAFEEHRAEEAALGIIAIPGEAIEGRTLLDRCFRNALRFSPWVQIYDGQFGRHCGPHYIRGLKCILTWLGEVQPAQSKCEVILHCLLPSSSNNPGPGRGWATQEIEKRIDTMLHTLNWRHGFRIRFYDRMMHDRFILSRQASFEIGRGVDFIDVDGLARDVSVHQKNPVRINTLIVRSVRNLRHDWAFSGGSDR